MNRFFKKLYFLLFLLFFVSSLAQNQLQSENLVVKQLSASTFQHISYLQTEDFGKVACNGMIIVNNGEALVVDAPVHNSDSEELISWIENELQCKLKAVVATHFHNDCIGGLQTFHKREIPSYSNALTITLIQKNGGTKPQIGFDESLQLQLGSEKVELYFFGQGHTLDNIVVHFPKENILFGGCLVKAMGASKGFVGDANIDAWPETIGNLKTYLPDVSIVVPGHGEAGGQELLDYTQDLFTKQ